MSAGEFVLLAASIVLQIVQFVALYALMSREERLTGRVAKLERNSVDFSISDLDAARILFKSREFRREIEAMRNPAERPGGDDA